MKTTPLTNNISRRPTLVVWAVFVLLCAVSASSTDFYVSSTGSDKCAGSVSKPWKTIARVNRGTYSAGDRIFFEGGTTFTGTLQFTSGSSGTSTNPIIVTSYGSSRATIAGGSGYGMSVYNSAGFYVTNINFVGSSGNTKSGIQFYVDLSGNVKLDTVFINQVDVSGFTYGIVIGAWNKLTGYKNVSITASRVHDNTKDGINIYGYTSSTLVGYPLQNIYIGHTTAFNNQGVAGATQATGSGIVVGNADGVVIEHCLAYNNGANNTHNGGPVGIWAWDSNNVLMQYNESHHNHTNSSVDGGGFDFDGGVTNSTLQYNYSHDNDGPGYAVVQYSGARASRNNTVRYNISQNDGRKNSMAGIQLWNGGSGVQNVNIFNNTVFMSPSGSWHPKALWLQSATKNVSVRDNILLTTGNVPAIQAVSEQSGVSVQGNVYWASGGTMYIYWPTGTYTDLASFRAATGLELYNSSPVGAVIDPKLNAPGTGGSINNSDLLNTLTAYKPTAGSPVIDTALTLSLFGINAGSSDFFGNAIYRGSAYDVGAIEY